MSDLNRIWAGWRASYVESAVRGHPKDKNNKEAAGISEIFSQLAASEHSDDETFIVHRGQTCFAVLNIYPYCSGHTLILPYRVVENLEDLTPEEFQELWKIVRDAAVAIKTAYDAQGINIGTNLGKSAGAGIPEHLHVHCLPRWAGDTNFMSSVANARVLPEPLDESWRKLKKAWPESSS